MSQIQISLEGTSAIAFAEALKGLPGYEVTYEVEPSDVVVRGEKFDRVLVILTTVVALGTSTVKLADNAVSLAEHVRDFSSQPVKSAVVVVGDKKVTLENATPAQVVEIFKEVGQ
jgi:hypothetical protein